MLAAALGRRQVPPDARRTRSPAAWTTAGLVHHRRRRDLGPRRTGLVGPRRAHLRGAEPAIVYASVQARRRDLAVDRRRPELPRGSTRQDGAARALPRRPGLVRQRDLGRRPHRRELRLVGGIDLWRSTDGGDTLAEISTWWDPRLRARRPPLHRRATPATTARRTGASSSATTAVFTDRGRAHRRQRRRSCRASTAGRSSSTTTASRSSTAAAGNTTSGVIIGGAQDNGTLCLRPGRGHRELDGRSSAATAAGARPTRPTRTSSTASTSS